MNEDDVARLTFAVGDLWSLFLQTLPLAAMVYTFFATRQKNLYEKISASTAKVDDHVIKVEEELKAASLRVDRNSARVERLEQTVGSMPGKDEMYKLQLRLTEMGGDMKAMLATMGAIKESQDQLHDIVSRHEDHLRES